VNILHDTTLYAEKPCQWSEKYIKMLWNGRSLVKNLDSSKKQLTCQALSSILSSHFGPSNDLVSRIFLTPSHRSCITTR
jgi:hypothetical protein